MRPLMVGNPFSPMVCGRGSARAIDLEPAHRRRSEQLELTLWDGPNARDARDVSTIDGAEADEAQMTSPSAAVPLLLGSVTGLAMVSLAHIVTSSSGFRFTGLANLVEVVLSAFR